MDPYQGFGSVMKWASFYCSLNRRLKSVHLSSSSPLREGDSAAVNHKTMRLWLQYELNWGALPQRFLISSVFALLYVQSDYAHHPHLAVLCYWGRFYHYVRGAASSSNGSTPCPLCRAISPHNCIQWVFSRGFGQFSSLRDRSIKLGTETIRSGAGTFTCEPTMKVFLSGS